MTDTSDDDAAFDQLGDDWFDPPADEEPPEHPSWWRSTMLVVGLLVAAAMLVVPLWNVVRGVNPPVSDGGLELCGFDYCVVQEAMSRAGHALTMSRLTGVLLTEEEARSLAEALADHLGVEPVTLEVVDRLEGRVTGSYDPSSRHILIQRPARAWIVLHEVAHTVVPGHGEEFQEVLAELARADVVPGG